MGFMFNDRSLLLPSQGAPVMIANRCRRLLSLLMKGAAQSACLDLTGAAAGLAISETQGSSRETANGRGAAPPPPPPLPPGPDTLKPESQQGQGQEEKEGKSARKPDRAIYQPVARPAVEGENSASGSLSGLSMTNMPKATLLTPLQYLLRCIIC